MRIEKPMNPGFLMRKTTVFSEINNLVYHIDAIVIDRMLKLLEVNHDDGLNEIYRPLIEEFGGRPFEEIVVKVQSKQTPNPLCQYCDISARSRHYHSTDKEFDPVESYNIDHINYRELLQVSNQFGKTPFLLTSLGGAITMLIKDNNLDCLYLYAPVITDELNAEIGYTFRDAQNVVLLDGSLQEAINKIPRCNNYFLQEIESIKYIPDGDIVSEILVPGYIYNQTFDIFGKTNSKDALAYYDAHKLDINLVSVPL